MRGLLRHAMPPLSLTPARIPALTRTPALIPALALTLTLTLALTLTLTLTLAPALTPVGRLRARMAAMEPMQRLMVGSLLDRIAHEIYGRYTGDTREIHGRYTGDRGAPPARQDRAGRLGLG